MTAEELQAANEAYALEIRRIYEEAEVALTKKVATRLERGIDRPGWVERALADVRAVNKELAGEVGKLRKLDPQIEDFISKAYENGAALGEAELIRHNIGAVNLAEPVVRGAGIRRLVMASVGALQESHLRILRSATDAYRDVIAQAAAGGMTGEFGTLRQAAQSALNRFADKGITGFIDRKGRRWDVASYTEMALRSATGQASVQGHLDVLRANGVDLVIVSASPEPCDLCIPWEGAVLSQDGGRDGEAVSIGKIEGSVDDAISAGLFHANCVPGDILASGPRPLAAFSRWYDGEVVVINTAGGVELTITPNHPVLTPEGWVAAGLLNKGDNVLRYIGQEGMAEGVDPDEELIPSAIGDVFDALRQSKGMITRRVPVSSEDFHGDGQNGEVDVVWTDSLLRDGNEVGKPFKQSPFGPARTRLGGLLSDCSIAEFVKGTALGAAGSMGVGCQGGEFGGGHSGDAPSCGSTSADVGAALEKPATDSTLTDAKCFSEVILPLTGNVAIDEIINVARREFAGHVYNLHTTQDWFACNSIITHNCTHSLEAYFDGETRPMDISSVEERQSRYAERLEQRHNERGIRKWKRRQAAAITDQETRLSAAKVKEWQAKQRVFIAKTGRLREYGRESVTRAR